MSDNITNNSNPEQLENGNLSNVPNLVGGDFDSDALFREMGIRGEDMVKQNTNNIHLIIQNSDSGPENGMSLKSIAEESERFNKTNRSCHDAIFVIDPDDVEYQLEAILDSNYMKSKNKTLVNIICEGDKESLDLATQVKSMFSSSNNLLEEDEINLYGGISEGRVTTKLTTVSADITDAIQENREDIDTIVVPSYSRSLDSADNEDKKIFAIPGLPYLKSEEYLNHATLKLDLPSTKSYSFCILPDSFSNEEAQALAERIAKEAKTKNRQVVFTAYPDASEDMIASFEEMLRDNNITDSRFIRYDEQLTELRPDFSSRVTNDITVDAFLGAMQGFASTSNPKNYKQSSIYVPLDNMEIVNNCIDNASVDQLFNSRNKVILFQTEQTRENQDLKEIGNHLLHCHGGSRIQFLDPNNDKTLSPRGQNIDGSVFTEDQKVAYNERISKYMDGMMEAVYSLPVAKGKGQDKNSPMSMLPADYFNEDMKNQLKSLPRSVEVLQSLVASEKTNAFFADRTPAEQIKAYLEKAREEQQQNTSHAQSVDNGPNRNGGGNSGRGLG